MTLESISTGGDAHTYDLAFRRGDGRSVGVRVVLDAAGAVAATPAFDSIGPWTNVNDVLDVIVPAVRAFDRAVGAAAQD